jgi:hypothetical protein
MKGELKELLFAQLQALSRAYQSSVSIMSAYEREFERLEKELADERAGREKERGENEALKLEARRLEASNDELKLEASRLEASNDELKLEVRSLEASNNDLKLEVYRLEAENDEEDDPLSVV